MADHPADAAFEEFRKTSDYAKAHGYTHDQTLFPRIVFSAGWRAALAWFPIQMRTLEAAMQKSFDEQLAKAVQELKQKTE
jgi:hypothetical protein